MTMDPLSPGVFPLLMAFQALAFVLVIIDYPAKFLINAAIQLNTFY